MRAVFSVSEIQIYLVTLSPSDNNNNYVTTQDLSFTASLNNDSTDSTTGAVQLTLEIYEEENEKSEYELQYSQQSIIQNCIR